MGTLINYVQHSRFKGRILEGLRGQRAAFIQGHDVVIHFEEVSQGFSGDIVVRVPTDVPDAFYANWHHPDRTRFPARIRAAATVLMETSEQGVFRITHDAGVLTISTID